MQSNSPFLRILATLDRKQFKRFGTFLESPFSLPYRQPQLLYDYLSNGFNTWHSPLHQHRNALSEVWDKHPAIVRFFSRQRISATLFPDEPHNDPRMRRIISLSKKALEKFLLVDAVLNDPQPYTGQVSLLRRFLDQGDITCLRLYGKAFTEQNQKDFANDEPELHHFLFRNELAQTEAFMRIQDFGKTDFQKANDHLDRFYIQHKLRLAAAMHALGPMQYQFDISMEQEIAQFLGERGNLDSPLIELYRLIAQMTTSSHDKGSFSKAIELLDQNASSISDYDFRQLTGFLLVYLDQKKLEPGTDVRGQIFNLAKALVDRQVIYIEGKIVVTWFNRIVFAALHVNELSWLESFLYANEGLVIGHDGKQLWQLSMLRYTFAMNAYTQVLKQIEPLDFQSPRFAVWARILKVKALLELALMETDADLRFVKVEDLVRELKVNIAYIRSREGLDERDKAAKIDHLKLIKRVAELIFLSKGDQAELQVSLDEMIISPYEKKWLLAKIQSQPA